MIENLNQVSKPKLGRSATTLGVLGQAMSGFLTRLIIVVHWLSCVGF